MRKPREPKMYLMMPGEQPNRYIKRLNKNRTKPHNRIPKKFDYKSD